MSNIMMFSDVHFKYIGSFSPFNKITNEGITIEMKRSGDSIDFVKESVEKYKPDLLICLGDVFHSLNTNQNIVVSYTSRKIKELYDVCKSTGTEFYILNGNHDYINFNYSMIDCLECDIKIKNVLEIDNLSFIPFMSDVDYMRKEIITHAIKGNITFIHDELNGFRYNNKKIVENSIDFTKEDVNIFAGHIHIRQSIKNINYIGSLYCMSYSEYSTEGNGITLLRNKKDIEFINNYKVKPIKSINIKDLDEINFDDYDGLVIFYENDEDINIDIPIPYIKRRILNNKYSENRNIYLNNSMSYKEMIENYLNNNEPKYIDLFKKYFKGE